MRFHHIGYAVANIQAYLDDFVVPLFAPLDISVPIADPVQKVRVCFVRMNGGTLIELVEPLAEDSPVHAVIGSKRGGVYHLCYEVEDLDGTIARMREKRCLPLGKPVPAVAFSGRRIVFMMTPQRDLLEFVESPKAAAQA